MTLLLAYWDVRGFAGHIRLMLEYTKSNYTEKFYVVGDGGQTEEEKIRVDVLEQQCLDLRASFVRMCYTDFEGLKPDYMKALPEALKLFSDFLGQRKWFAGDKLTYVDFIMHEMLDMQRIFHPPCLDNFNNLKAFLQRFEALDGIGAYLKSGRFIREPIHNRMAKWSFKKGK